MKPLILNGLIIFAVACLLGYNVVWKGYQTQVAQIDTQVRQEKAAREAQAEAVQLLDGIDQYRKRLAPAPDPSWLVKQVITLGEQAGLKKFNTDQEPLQETSQYVRLAVRLDFQATYHQLGALLDNVERAGYFLRVERMNVAKPVKDGGPATVGLVISTLYMPQVTAASTR